MERACDDDELVYRCDGCDGVLEASDAEPHVIYDCFHVLHAACARGHDDACPRCHTPRLVHDDDDDDPPEPVVDEARRAPACSPPDHNNSDEDSALLASDGMGTDGGDRPGGGGASMSGSGCNDHASRLGCCCSRRVAELESRLEEKSAALTETTNVLESKLERAQSRLCRLEEMYDKLEEEELIRLRDDKRPREIEIEDAGKERKKLRNGGRSVSSFPQGPD